MVSRPTSTVLVVDDEPEILDSIRATLRDEGWQIVTTTSPIEALALVESGGVDLVISDIDMPEMDGVELVARLRRTHPHVVRILLTADASLRSAIAAINHGEVYRYLLKPWNDDELRSTVRDALARLTELRRLAAAERHAGLRHMLMTELAQAHPGIDRVDRLDGVFVLDVRAVADAVTELRSPRLLSLLAPDHETWVDADT